MDLKKQVAKNRVSAIQGPLFLQHPVRPRNSPFLAAEMSVKHSLVTAYLVIYTQSAKNNLNKKFGHKPMTTAAWRKKNIH